jgi:hypothetical protein
MTAAVSARGSWPVRYVRKGWFDTWTTSPKEQSPQLGTVNFSPAVSGNRRPFGGLVMARSS